MTTTPVSFLSEDYFSLVAASPELAGAFALGGRVIAISGGIAYEVVPADTAVDPIDVPLPDVSTTTSDQPAQEATAIDTPTNTPNSSESEPSGPTSGPCAGGLLPLLLLPLLAALVKKPRQE
jgi:hypothetical protein